MTKKRMIQPSKMENLFPSNRYFDTGFLAEVILINLEIDMENDPRCVRIIETYMRKGYIANVIDLIRSQIDTIVSN